MRNSKKAKLAQDKELAGYRKMPNGDVVPMYTTDKVWLKLKAKLIEKVEEIEKNLKQEV